MTSILKKALKLNLSPFRIHLAHSLYTRFFPDTDNENLFWLLFHLAEQAGNGHLRTDMGKIAEEAPQWAVDLEDLPLRLQESAEALVKTCESSGLIGRLEADDDAADSLPIPRPPLVLTPDGSYLYFLRRRREEDLFLTMLSKRAFTGSNSMPENKSSPAEAIVSLIKSGRKLILLTGGPGTGKTTTIEKVLELLGPSYSTILTAPTGRAASRMAENIPGHIGRTLHNLLGIYPGKKTYHSQKNPLETNLVVVDEASMVDLPLMNTLLSSMAPETVLLLAGDPDQLPSVEAGALFGDLIAGTQKIGDPLRGSILQLTTVYRSNTAVLRAAAAIREGRMNALLSSIDGSSVNLLPLEGREKMAEIIASEYRQNTHEFTALTPQRRGPWGVIEMNEKISRILGGRDYPLNGMPIVITRNDASRNLWNGERGLLKNEGDRLNAVFQTSDGEQNLPLALLPGWEPAWMQTIHKSQGSEYDSVSIILPNGAERLLSREILYTALTRARDRVNIFADEHTLARALEKKVIRNSRIRRWAAGIRGVPH